MVGWIMGVILFLGLVINSFGPVPTDADQSLRAAIYLVGMAVCFSIAGVRAR